MSPPSAVPSPVACAAASREAVVQVGGAFMTGPAVRAAAAALDLTFLELYFAGRCGVLGPAPAPVVAAALTFFEPAFVAGHWASALAKVTPAAATANYLEACRDTGRSRWVGMTDLARPVALLGRVVEAADLAGLPLAEGWRTLPPARDDAARLAQLLQVLREHRGGLHAMATRSCGLSPQESLVAGPDGPDRARVLGWPGPLPAATERMRAAHARAERLTDRLAAPAYAVLSPAERRWLVHWCADQSRTTPQPRESP
jgi:hypothetical protein